MDNVDLRSLLLPPDTSESDETQAQTVATESPLTPAEALHSLLERLAPESAPLKAPTQSPMAELLETRAAASEVAELPSSFSSMLPSLLVLKSHILQELEVNVAKLLSLNPSRREGIAQYLDRVAGGPAGPTTSSGAADAAGGLRRWVEGVRTPTQQAALHTYFEELALIVLGEALVLKAWSDRGLRTWSPGDLAQLNWALSSALKPHVPLDRDGWQVTRPNLYSWYVPSTAIQEEIWKTFDEWRVTDEGPGFLTSLLAPSGRGQASDPAGYDPRLFKAIWEALPGFLTSGGAFTAPHSAPALARRNRIAFSPTLRDGSIVRTGPVSVDWVGTENSLFQLMLAELGQLWWGPSAPPLWAHGNGLEAHSREQLALPLNCAKPSLLARISEMEACDVAYVSEERLVRTQGKSAESVRYREQLEVLPYFKKIRKPSTTLGALQACVALSKLRPGGLFWWAREDSLSEQDGAEMLNFLLDRARLICEWDFSGVQHSLPASLPLFPKHLYFFAREPRLEERLMHRPLRIVLQGNLRSHVEIPLLFQDAFHAAQQPEAPFSFHGQWQARVHRSPTTQKEWSEHWPDPACQATMLALERLRESSLPLAHAVTVCRTPETLPKTNARWTVDSTLRGLWVRAEQDGERRKIVAEALPLKDGGAEGQGYLILVPDESWTATLITYLESELVQSWLEHHAERRGQRWVLDEQTVKWIPVPKVLFQALGLQLPGNGPDRIAPSLAKPLPGEWERLASEVAYRPKQALDALTKLARNPGTLPEDAFQIRSAIYVRAARALAHVKAGLQRLAPVVSDQGRISWKAIIDILPASEMTSVTLHSEIKVSGNLPLHVPVARMDRVKIPAPGILLSTELGFTLHLASDHAHLPDLLWQQLEGMSHPTWSELLQYLRVPRRMEIAEATAQDILKSYGEQQTRAHELTELLSACTLF